MLLQIMENTPNPKTSEMALELLKIIAFSNPENLTMVANQNVLLKFYELRAKYAENCAEITGQKCADGAFRMFNADYVSTEDGKGYFAIEQIPVGKNRIISVQALNNGVKIDGIVISALKDIVAGENVTSVLSPTATL